ncbi:hypothetical protein NT2_04_04680 [Caenibius tardaugens NBRC 16725]|uniref:DUF1134 domain-containing protein n=1 Tax=Caenibius tardaugens NBRC 16725 TaxID=1219035 RepID=U2YKH1_9SPHN|nr:DUF1134 domain-containing protein [Caenibius tardaugens]AZI35899.1 DUF1134 domain-containing protein [Caenibius tardaugens NBRC 16725]GAD49055.1 hypothetical protein NT2_04_04680 [Caenibius tardaugens NBRC 16725]
MMQIATTLRRRAAGTFMGIALIFGAAPLAAQDMPIDGDLAAPGSAQSTTAAGGTPDSGSAEWAGENGTPVSTASAPVTGSTAEAAGAASADPATAVADGGTYKKDDLVGAAEGLFGKGAKGLAGLIEDLLAKQGEPNAYIVGREGGGALVVGLRYGSGTLYHKVEGERPVYWTGPSIGFDAGANVGNTFVLVYNLYDTEDIYKRFPAVEGQVYAIGGFNASYLRNGSTVLIPIRVGAGLRLGVNAGYMKIRKKQNWIPF